MTRNQIELEARSASLKKKRIVVISWVGIVVLVLAFFGIGPLILDAYDRQHPLTRTCQVTSAEAGSSSTVSRTGVGSSSEQVVIESNDCGELLLREGFDKGNSPEIANTFESGRQYDFILGGGSVRLRGLLDLFGLSIEARLVQHNSPAGEK